MIDNNKFCEEYFQRRLEEAKSGNTDSALDLINQARTSLEEGEDLPDAVRKYLVNALDGLFGGIPADKAFLLRKTSGAMEGKNIEVHRAIAAAVERRIRKNPKANEKKHKHVVNAAIREVEIELQLRGIEPSSKKTIGRVVDDDDGRLLDAMRSFSDEELDAIIEAALSGQ